MIRITKGLDLPIEGEPEQAINDGPELKTVALIGDDYLGLKPTMEVAVDDFVKQGQLLFTDKKMPGVRYISPGCGKIVEINRGAKRAFQSIVIELEGSEEETFQSYQDSDLSTLGSEKIRENLINAGLWPVFRTRPYSKVPAVDSQPHSIFVTAIDTNPLAAKPEVVIAESEREFIFGLQLIKQLTEGKLYLIQAPDAKIPGSDVEDVTTESFAGPHPAGLAGTHIHFLDPVSEKKTVWYLNYQDVIAIGKLFVTGKLPVERVVSLAGPTVIQPRLIRTRLGAKISELTSGEVSDGHNRIISGSVLSGRISAGPFDYLGRYHLQVSALAEGTEREFLGWQKPGFNKFSIKRVFASACAGSKNFRFTTSTEGSKRAMVPIGMYENVMPLDIIPTFLLRSLIVEDTEQATALGCLELDEEDLALCTFVCPGKYEYGPILRKNLQTIESEG